MRAVHFRAKPQIVFEIGSPIIGDHNVEWAAKCSLQTKISDYNNAGKPNCLQLLMKRTIVFIALTFISVGGESQAAKILGNLPQTNDNFNASVVAGSVQWGISFNMPAESREVGVVVLRLREYSTTEGDVATVGFFADNGSDAPGAQVGSLLVSPPSNSNSMGQFEFMPAAPLTLAVSTKYWLVVDAAAGQFQWQGSFPGITPTSNVGVSFGTEKLSENDGASYIDSEGRLTSFWIDTNTVIPEPHSMAPVMLAAAAVTLFRMPRVRKTWNL
jgi:hypothetical protein